MLIEIETRPLGPLKVLSAIPDAPLATLEGLNGIGKTLAVRLLQLCTGTSPYEFGSGAWISLCEGLGPFTVRASRLPEATTLRWSADTRTWRELTSPPDTSDFEAILINGLPANMEQVRTLLSVHRIGGDEGLVETLAREADLEAESVSRVYQNLTAEEIGPLADLERHVARAKDAVASAGPEEYSDLRRRLDQASARAVQLQTQARAATERRAALADAVELAHRLDRARAQAPGLAGELTALEDHLAKLQRNREAALRSLTRASAQVAQAAPWLNELKNAQRTLARNRERLAKEVTLAAAAAAPLGVDPSNEPIETEIKSVGSQLESLRERLLALEAGPALLAALGESTVRLEALEGRGLGGQVAWESPQTGQQLTVHETREGMAVRQGALASQPPSPEALALRQEMNRLEGRQSALISLRGHVTEAARRQRLVDQNEIRVQDALEKATPAVAVELQSLEAERKALDEALLEAASQRARLRQQLGEGDPQQSQDAMAEELRAACQELEVTPDDLGEELSTATDAEGDLTTRSRAADETTDTLRREQLSFEAAVQRTIQTLRHDSGTEWLRLGLGEQQLFAAARGGIEEQLTLIDAARSKLVSVQERLGRLRTQMQAIGGALRGIGQQLRDNPLRANEYVPELQKALGDRFSEWFESDRVRSEIFPGAIGRISVDLRSREVRWTENGQQRARPFEAFSSGEQAFAYTRAQLALLDEDDESRVGTRLIVLDEFGAFIAHDRLSGLLNYLRDRARDHPRDQVLVILPLSRDYASLAENAIGEEATVYRRLASDVASHNYTVRALVS